MSRFREIFFYKFVLFFNRWIYIVRCEISEIKVICKQIQSDLNNKTLSRYPYKILFSPRKVRVLQQIVKLIQRQTIILKSISKLFIAEHVFEQEGLYDFVSLGELENDLIQLDDDVLSMEYPKFFTNYFLVGTFLYLGFV